MRSNPTPFFPTGRLDARATPDCTAKRVTRDVFTRFKVSRFVNKVMPEPLKVAESIAKTTGAVAQVHGTEAARQLELTTQIPAQSRCVTSGSSKRISKGQF